MEPRARAPHCTSPRPLSALFRFLEGGTLHHCGHLSADLLKILVPAGGGLQSWTTFRTTRGLPQEGRGGLRFATSALTYSVRLAASMRTRTSPPQQIELVGRLRQAIGAFGRRGGRGGKPDRHGRGAASDRRRRENLLDPRTAPTTSSTSGHSACAGPMARLRTARYARMGGSNVLLVMSSPRASAVSDCAKSRSLSTTAKRRSKRRSVSMRALGPGCVKTQATGVLCL